MSIYWLGFVTIVFLIIQGFVFGRWGLGRMEYNRSFSTDAAFEGEEIEMVEEIANRKTLPVPWLRLESMIPVGLRFQHQTNLDISEGKLLQNHKSIFSLMPYKKITRRHRVTCIKRGDYRLSSAAMTSGDILSLVIRSKKISFDARILVYPRIIDLPDIDWPFHGWQGDYIVRRWILPDPFSFAGVREYIPGDPLNRIHWKATARTGELQIHNPEFTANRRIMIYVNFDITENMWNAVTEPELIEKALSLAATFASVSLSQGIDTGFGCNGSAVESGFERSIRIFPQNGKDQLTLLLEMMARVELISIMSFADFLQDDFRIGTTQTDYLILTSYRSDALNDLADRLRSSGNAVEWIMLREWMNPSIEGEGDREPNAS